MNYPTPRPRSTPNQTGVLRGLTTQLQLEVQVSLSVTANCQTHTHTQVFRFLIHYSGSHQSNSNTLTLGRLLRQNPYSFPLILLCLHLSISPSLPHSLSSRRSPPDLSAPDPLSVTLMSNINHTSHHRAEQ